MRLAYTVRLADLFWMWLTSWITLATIAFGLFFISVLLVPGDYPRALDVAAGIFLIVAAFTVAPLFWIRVTRMSALIGLPIVLVVDANGVGGLADRDPRRTAMDPAAPAADREPGRRPPVPAVHLSARLGGDPAGRADGRAARGARRDPASTGLPDTWRRPKSPRPSPCAGAGPSDRAAVPAGPVADGQPPILLTLAWTSAAGTGPEKVSTRTRSIPSVSPVQTGWSSVIVRPSAAMVRTWRVSDGSRPSSGRPTPGRRRGWPRRCRR